MKSKMGSFRMSTALLKYNYQAVPCWDWGSLTAHKTVGPFPCSDLLSLVAMLSSVWCLQGGRETWFGWLAWNILLFGMEMVFLIGQ